MVGQRGGGQLADLLAGRGADGLVAGRVGVPDQRVGGVPDGEFGGRQVGGGTAQRAAGVGCRAAGLGEAAEVRLGGLLGLLGGVVAQAVAQLGGCLVEVGGGALRGVQGALQVGVLGAGRLQPFAAFGEPGGGGAQQQLGVLGVGRDEVLGQFGVCLAGGGGGAFGLAAQAAELLAGGGGAGLDGGDQLLGPGDGGLAGRAVGAVRAGEQFLGAAADLVGEAVELGGGGRLVTLGAGLLGAQVGPDADLVVELGGRPVRLT